ncbi:hypothetical protein Sjap_012956 [Stephania japonica]|uniref:Uncharacterized protein n=1 Tax=Stephania japonica TaxID=461633 RepID=A0AAP0NYR7_9MAGN
MKLGKFKTRLIQGNKDRKAKTIIRTTYSSAIRCGPSTLCNKLDDQALCSGPSALCSKLDDPVHYVVEPARCAVVKRYTSVSERVGIVYQFPTNFGNEFGSEERVMGTGQTVIDHFSHNTHVPGPDPHHDSLVAYSQTYQRIKHDTLHTLVFGRLTMCESTHNQIGIVLCVSTALSRKCSIYALIETAKVGDAAGRTTIGGGLSRILPMSLMVSRNLWCV